MRLTRRRFLAEGGRAGAALALASFPALSAAPRRASPNERLRVGVIGVGGRGSALLRWAMEHEAVEIAVLCDVNEPNLARSAALVRSAGGEEPRTVEDFLDVIADDSIDLVFVATPHHWHAPIALRALEGGKHVYLEKPASHVFREGRALVDAAKRAAVLFQHGTQMRSSEVTARAAEALASGVLGEIQMSKAWGVEPRSHPAPVPDEEPPEGLDWDRWLGPAPKRPFNRNRFRRWNNYRDYGNGEIGGDGIHDIDMARWGLGADTHPLRIIAHGSRVHVKGESEFPDNMVVTYEYPSGKALVYENRNFAPYKTHGWDNGNIFYGTEGYMVFSRRGYFQTYLGAGEKEGPGMRGGAGNRENVHGFLDAVRSGKPTNADAEVAHLSCGLVHLGEVAYRTGRALEFDPETERIRDDEEAGALLTKSYRSPWSLGKESG